MMPRSLTLVPTAWTREAGQREVIEYSVYGLPSEKQTVILMCPGGWRVIRDPLPEFDQRETLFECGGSRGGIESLD